MPIIGNPILLGGGGGNATIIFNAPKNSSIVYSGPESGIIIVGSSTTQASAVLKKGTYTFESYLDIPDSASSTVSTKIYETTVAITGDATINLYPANMLYWYGITGSNVGGWYYLTQSSQTFTQEANAMTLTWGGSPAGGTAMGAVRTNDSFSFTGFTKIIFRAAYRHSGNTSNPNTMPYGGYSTTAWTSMSGTTFPITVKNSIGTSQYGQTETPVSITAGETSGYPGFSANACDIVMYAIWLE